ncbi:MAG TPA: hypothetical protein PKZ08_08695 [Vicinamibacterales bacterium]|nr:hypothetical protein [Vicinamibacterales bacterium]
MTKMDDDTHPDNKTIWDAVMQARMALAELKGMMTMHLREGEHHHPPCAPAANLQRTMLAAAGASILALLSALGSIALEFMRR